MFNSNKAGEQIKAHVPILHLTCMVLFSIPCINNFE